MGCDRYGSRGEVLLVDERRTRAPARRDEAMVAIHVGGQQGADLVAGIGGMMRRIIRRSDLRDDTAHDVSDELRFHLEMRTQEFIERGMSPEDARRAAAGAFGDLGAIDAELRHAGRLRDRTRARRDRVQEIVADIRFALRTLRKNAGFTAATLATLALGIGAATAVFTVVNGVMLRPLPYPDASRLVMVWMSSKQYGEELPLSSGFYSDVAEDTRSLAQTAAFRSWRYTLTSSAG